ncbi:MAG: U32 family peptidase [Desulfobacteraceae bacterium]|nr:U32 family peptidase [Desulfobacteraceae bacterium]
MSKKSLSDKKPEILAPAGDRDAFLAALAAGADAVYCGLKQFSARMAADNFTVSELAGLTRLAHDRGSRVYVALNSLIKPDELEEAGNLVLRLKREVRPDALIIQDPGVLSLAAQAGFKGEIHFSTLANVSFASAVKLARFFPNVTRVVLPREFSIDEIKTVSAACPKGLSLEVFVHGALCYGVSGRCYWSSFLGGKSGLRGRCVQPCRRIYNQGRQRARFFSCQDLWIDVLTKVLLDVPAVSGFKIEGRKKGPHYVYYTTAAYKLLRDNPEDSEAKKTALSLLENALGRNPTHYRFLPQRPWNPIDTDTHTGSGNMMGRVQGPRLKPYLEPREDLLAGDLLRIGYEDESWHRVMRMPKSVPKKGRFYLNLSEKERPANGTPVFLIDRREPELAAEIEKLAASLENINIEEKKPSVLKLSLPQRKIQQHPSVEMEVMRSMPEQGPSGNDMGIWLSPDMNPAAVPLSNRIWWWLPPVIWPDSEAGIKQVIDGALDKGFKRFVLNSPWQMIFFPPGKKVTAWAGPFCNISNELAMENLAALGFSGVIVSPELGKKDFTRLPARSPLPLGALIYGNWPLCISRTVSDSLAAESLFKSPRGEYAWASRMDDNYWIYPDWVVDLTDHEDTLQNLGYRMFVRMSEPVPEGIKMKKRPGKWNWDIGLK